MKGFYKKIGVLFLALVLAGTVSGCGKGASSSQLEEKPSVYPFVNTLKEPADNALQAVEAPVLLEQIKEKAEQVNPEIVGWLQVPGTDIDQPVVQTYNNSKYMRLDYTGKYSFQGCYWVDYECRIGNRTTDRKSVV